MIDFIDNTNVPFKDKGDKLNAKEVYNFGIGGSTIGDYWTDPMCIRYIEIPKDSTNGDYAFPCFRLAKTLKKAPPVIAGEIKEKIKLDENIITKIDVIGGYLNFYINKDIITNQVLERIENNQQYININIGKGNIIFYKTKTC